MRNFWIVSYTFAVSLIFDYISFILMRATGIDYSFDWKYIISNLTALVLAIIFSRWIKPLYIMTPSVVVCFALIGFMNSIFVTVGIITVVWHGIFGFFCGVYLHADNILIDFRNNIKEATGHTQVDVIDSLKNDWWNLFKLLIQFIMTFGVILGVCMSILFSFGYEETQTKITAIKMVFGFGCCVGMVYLWYFIPILEMYKLFRKSGY